MNVFGPRRLAMALVDPRVPFMFAWSGFSWGGHHDSQGPLPLPLGSPATLLVEGASVEVRA